MGRKKLTMSEKIRRYLAAHPEAKPKEVAEKLGCKPSFVSVIKCTQKKVQVPTAEGVDIDAAHKKAKPKRQTFKVFVPVPPEVKAEVAKVDVVNHPPHYTDGGIETIDFIQAKLTKAEFIGYLKGNALKYGSRIGKKGEADVDAGKMVWYATKLREVLHPTP